MKTGVKIAIGVGIAAALGVAGYFTYNYFVNRVSSDTPKEDVIVPEVKKPIVFIPLGNTPITRTDTKTNIPFVGEGAEDINKKIIFNHPYNNL